VKNFEYYVPTRIVFGKDTHTQVGKIIKEYGFDKVLLHYGMGSVKKSGLYDEVVTSLNDCAIEYAELSGVQANPTLSLVKEGVRIAKEKGSQLVLAVGGGSVIDSAKLIAHGALYDGDPWDFVTRKAVPDKALPVATILTLSASGSEMSASCVITNDETNLKRGFGSKFNRPLFSICNPCLTYTVSPYQTACGTVDIMMHTIERYFTVSEPFDMSDQMVYAVIKTVMKAGKEALKNPCDYEARANLMWAGSVSHNDMTGVGTEFFMVCHQIEHELSGMFETVAHGAGLAIVFPAWAKYIYRYNPGRFADFATNALGIEKGSKTTEELALEGIETIENYFVSIGMPVRLSELGIEITDAHIEEMSEKCTFFGQRELLDYKNLGKEEIKEIYNLAR